MRAPASGSLLQQAASPFRQLALRAAVVANATRLSRGQRNIVLHGFYGAGNYGDEAILHASLTSLRRRFPKHRLVVSSFWPARVRQIHSVPAFDPRRVTPPALARLLGNTDAFLLGGGGLLKDFGKEDQAALDRQWLRWLEIAADHGVPTMLWSIGVDDVIYEQSKRRLNEVLAKTDVLTVRDAGSAAALRQLGVRRSIEVTADPAFLLGTGRPRRRPDSRNLRIGVSLRHWYTGEFKVADAKAFDTFLSYLAHSLDRIIDSHGANITFFSFRDTAHDDDRVVCNAVWQQMLHRSACTLVSISTEPGLYTNAFDHIDVLIGMRLHSLILAIAHGIPSIPITYMPKVSHLANSIDINLTCLTIHDCLHLDLLNVINCHINNYDLVSNKLIEFANRKQQAIEYQIDTLTNLINNTSSIS